MPVQLITPSEYARRRGCNEKAVRKAIDAGRISAIFDSDGRKMIDPAVADIQWAQNTRVRVRPNAPVAAPPIGAATPDAARAQSGATQPEPLKYDDHKRRQAAAEAERAELEVGSIAGRLLDRESAERGAFEAFRELRDAVFAAIPTQARKVMSMVELREVELVLQDELRAAFDGWEQRMQLRLLGAARK